VVSPSLLTEAAAGSEEGKFELGLSKVERARCLQNEKNGRLTSLLGDIPALLACTASVHGNQQADLHLCATTVSCKRPCGLAMKVCVIGGATRGIGQGIAVRFAISGAKVCVLGRFDGRILTGPGTLSDVLAQITSVGGEGLAVQCDLSKPNRVAHAVRTIVVAYGLVDVLVNNASLLYPVGIEQVDTKRFDLINHMCVRGTFLLTREVIPHMGGSACPHVLTVTPAPISDCTWLGPHVCYSGTKIGMGMLVAAWSVEFPDIRFNTLWPHKIVATFAVTSTMGADLDHAVTVAHMADPAYRIVTSDARSRFYLDTGALNDMNIADQSAWHVVPSQNNLYDAFMTEPLGLGAGQHVDFLSLPVADKSPIIAGMRLLLAGVGREAAAMAGTAVEAGAFACVIELTTDVEDTGARMPGGALDSMLVGAAPTSSLGTLATATELWECLFDLHCKAPYYAVAKALPLLRRSEQPRVVMVAQAPVCHPKSFAHSVPCAVISQIRGLYVVGMAEELNGSDVELGHVDVSAIWDATGTDPQASDCLGLLTSSFQSTSGKFFAACPEDIPLAQVLLGPHNYTQGANFADLTTCEWLRSEALPAVGLATFAKNAASVLPALRAERASARNCLRAAGMSDEQAKLFLESFWLAPGATTGTNDQSGPRLQAALLGTTQAENTLPHFDTSLESYLKRRGMHVYLDRFICEGYDTLHFFQALSAHELLEFLREDIEMKDEDAKRFMWSSDLLGDRLLSSSVPPPPSPPPSSPPSANSAAHSASLSSVEVFR